MAKRGRKPKPPEQLAAAGTARADRHPDPATAEKRRRNARELFGPPVKPDGLPVEAALAWDKYIEPAYWLDGSRQMSCVMLVRLWAEYIKDPEACGATKIAQLRQLMAEVGLTDERNRVMSGEEGGDDPYLD